MIVPYSLSRFAPMSRPMKRSRAMNLSPKERIMAGEMPPMRNSVNSPPGTPVSSTSICNDSSPNVSDRRNSGVQVSASVTTFTGLRSRVSIRSASLYPSPYFPM